MKRLFIDCLMTSSLTFHGERHRSLLKCRSQARSCERSMTTMKKSKASGLADARKNAETFEGGHVRALRDGDIPPRGLLRNSRTFRLLGALGSASGVRKYEVPSLSRLLRLLSRKFIIAVSYRICCDGLRIRSPNIRI